MLYIVKTCHIQCPTGPQSPVYTHWREHTQHTWRRDSWLRVSREFKGSRCFFDDTICRHCSVLLFGCNNELERYFNNRTIPHKYKPTPRVLWQRSSYVILVLSLNYVKHKRPTIYDRKLPTQNSQHNVYWYGVYIFISMFLDV